MRTILITLALIASLGKQAGAGNKEYSLKECESISGAIDFFLRESLNNRSFWG